MLYPFQTIAEFLTMALAGEIPAEDEETPDAEPADAEEAEEDAAATDDSEQADKDEPEVEEEADEPDEEDDKPEEDDPRDKASYKAEVKSLRAENRKRRLSERSKEATIKEFETEKLKAERSKMAEVDRLKAEKADLEAENAEQDAMLQSAVKVNVVESEAAKLGFQDTTDAVTMLGEKFGQIVIDATGNIDRAEVADMLTELLDAKPYLKRVTENEQKVKKVRTAPTNEPSDAKVQSKIPSTKTTDDEAITQEITELNQAGQGAKAFRVLLAKRFRPAREKLKKTLFSSE